MRALFLLAFLSGACSEEVVVDPYGDGATPSPTPPPKRAPADASKLLANGEREFRNAAGGNYDASVRLFGEALAASPAPPLRAKILYARHKSFMAQQKLPQAIADLSAGIELDGAHVLAYLQRAKLALKTGRCADAAADFGRVLALDAGKRDAHAGLPQASECAAALDRAQHARAAGRSDLVTAALSEAMADGRATAAPTLLMERAQAFLLLPGEDNINSALADLARVLKQEPNNVNAWALRGRSLLMVVDFATGA
jgi:tetratricopeptide (TPR) repeat protein